jgi:hypothetical protein
MKLLRILRIVIIAQMFPPLRMFMKSIAKNKNLLIIVFVIIIVTIIFSAVVLYNTEYIAQIDQRGKAGFEK